MYRRIHMRRYVFGLFEPAVTFGLLITISEDYRGFLVIFVYDPALCLMIYPNLPLHPSLERTVLEPRHLLSSDTPQIPPYPRYRHYTAAHTVSHTV